MNQQGFILVAVMSILLLLTLLAMGAAETSLMLGKQVSVQWQFWRTSTAVNNINHELAVALMRHKKYSCLVNYQTDNRYWVETADNWGHTTCGGNQMGVDAYSVIEDIPQGYCIDRGKEEPQPINFFRVTTQAKNQQGTVLRVQTVVAVAERGSGGDILTIPGNKHQRNFLPRSEKTDETCANLISQLSLGIQSWRME